MNEDNFHKKGDDEGDLILPPIKGKDQGKWVDDTENHDSEGVPLSNRSGGVKVHRDRNMEDVVERDAYEQRQ